MDAGNAFEVPVDKVYKGAESFRQIQMSKREDPEKIFLTRILKLGMHDGWFLYKISCSLVSK